MDLPDIAGEDDGSWTHVGDTGFQMANTEYEPSIRTDLPFATEQTGTSISENYDPMLSCSQLGSHCQVVSWSCHGRADFGIKRPAPFHAEPLIHDTLDDTVEQRVMAKQTVEVNFFLQYIKDVPEKTWREEREAIWETPIRRWIFLLEQWEAPEVPLIAAIQSKESFVEKAQIMVDVFLQ